METGAMLDEFLLAFAIMAAAASLCYLLNLGHFSSLVVMVGAACLVSYVGRSNGRGKDGGGSWVGENESPRRPQGLSRVGLTKCQVLSLRLVLRAAQPASVLTLAQVRA